MSTEIEKNIPPSGSGDEAGSGGKPVYTERKLKKSSLSTFLVMLCTLTTRLLGFVRNAVINAIFGDGGKADVLHAVFIIPNTLRKLFAEGALSSAFIPVISRAIVEDPTKERARRITRNLLAFQILLLVPLVTAAAVFAQPIIAVLVPFSDPAKQALAVELFRLVSSYILLISLAAVLMGVLNANSVFVPPALGPLFFSVSVISSILLFHQSLGIFSMALGIIAGGIAQVIYQIPFVYNKGYDVKLDFGFNHPEFKQILKQWGPILAASGIAAVNQLVAVSLASGLEDGSTTALNNALTFWQFPFGIVAASVTNVLFPRMSRQAAAENHEGLKDTMIYGINFLMILLIPAALGYMLFGKEIIALFLQRGNFTARGTNLAADVLYYYSIGLFSVGAFAFLQRFFYAMKDYKTPLYISGVVVAVDILLSLWLKETTLRVSGLALANTAAFSIGLIIMLFVIRMKFGHIKMKPFLVTGIKVCVTMTVMSGGLIFYKTLTAPLWTEGSSLENGLLILGAVTLAGIATFIFYYLFKVKVFRDLIKR